MTGPKRNWTSSSLSEIADYRVGKTPARANPGYWAPSPENVPWVTISDMLPYEVVETTSESISHDAFTDVFQSTVSPAGTLLMSFKLTIGRVAYLNAPACHNEAIISIFPSDQVDKRFLAYALSAIDYSQFQDRQVKGNTLNKAKLDKVPVAYPSALEEQRKIAEVLDGIRLQIAHSQAALSTIDAIRLAIMAASFGDGNDQSKRQIRKIGDMGTVVTGSTPPTGNREFYTPEEVPFITPGDITHGYPVVSTQKQLSRSGLGVSRPLPAQATCVVCIGSTIGKVGQTQAEVSVTNQQINSLIPSRDEFDADYITYLLSYHAERFREHSSPSTVPILSKGAFERIELELLSSIEDQERFSTALGVIDSRFILEQQRKELLESLFLATLRQIFTEN